jgi:site-specific recombinase XerD
MNLQELKRQFLEYLEIERGRSVKTVENYDRYLNRFFAFTKVTEPKQLTEDQIREFRLYLNRQPGTKLNGRTELMKRRTQNYYLIALRAFLKFLRKRGVSSLSSERIELAKVPERSLDLISAEELSRLVASPNVATLAGKRDRAILELLFPLVCVFQNCVTYLQLILIYLVMSFQFVAKVIRFVWFLLLTRQELQLKNI